MEELAAVGTGALIEHKPVPGFRMRAGDVREVRR
jgi:hypothetical protein